MSDWWDCDFTIEGDAIGTIFPNEEAVEKLKSLGCSFKVGVRRCGPEPLLLEDYFVTEVDGEYVIELRPEDAQRVAEFLAKGG